MQKEMGVIRSIPLSFEKVKKRTFSIKRKRGEILILLSKSA